MVTSKQFWLGLAGTSLLSSLAAFGLHAIPRLTPYWPLSLTAIVLFCLLSIGAFYAGRQTARSDNKHMFTNVVLGFTFVKMVFSAIIVVVYILVIEPEDKIFVLPFMLIYLLFTVFETIVLVKQARETGGKPKTEV